MKSFIINIFKNNRKFLMKKEGVDVGISDLLIDYYFLKI